MKHLTSSQLLQLVFIDVILTLFWCTGATAQILRIIPSAEADPGTAMSTPTMIFDNTQEMPGRVVFRAYLQWDDSTFTDVSNTVTWISSNPAVFESLGHGEFILNDPGSCVVSASLGEDFTDILPIHFERIDIQERELGTGAMPSSTPVHSAVLKMNVLAFFDQLESRGVPSDNVRSAATRSLFVDDRAFTDIYGIPRRWLDTNVSAEYLSKGLHFKEYIPGIGIPNPYSASMWCREPRIVLADRYADAIRDGALILPNGQLAPEGQVVWHEVVHLMIDDADIAFEAPPEADPPTETAEDEEEYWVHTLDTLIMPQILKAANFLSIAQPTHQDLWRLRNILIEIRMQMRDLKARNADLFALIMSWLGLQDINDNGGGSTGDGANNIPDFLDDWLEQKGFNFDTLPTTQWPIPEHGGDCGDGLIMVPGDFLDKQPGPEDEQFAFVIDACGNTFMLTRDPVLGFRLEPFSSP